MPEPGGVRGEQRRVDVGREPPAIDRGRHRRRMREAGDEVTAPQQGPVDAGQTRRLVNQPLQQVVGLGLASAAVGVDRHGVGEGAARRHEHGGDGVPRAHRVAWRSGGTAGAAAGHAGTQIGYDLHVQGEEPARFVQPEAGMGDIVAAMGGGDEVLAVAGRPDHRSAERAGRP